MLSCVSMTLTVRMMRNAAALYVDVNVHLHLKVFVILMLGSPTDTYLYHFKCQAPEFGP